MATAYFFFFLLGYEDSGTLIIMLWQMIVKDLFRYLKVWFIVLCAYTQAITSLTTPLSNAGAPQNINFWDNFWSVLGM